MTIYASPNYPVHWVVDDGSQLWLVPAIADGWTRRSPLKVLPNGAEEVKAFMAMGCGIPA